MLFATAMPQIQADNIEMYMSFIWLLLVTYRMNSIYCQYDICM